MAIVASDILLNLSTTAGAAGNSTAQADPNASLGKYVSTTTMSTGANGLFDDITGDENAASAVDYRCIFVVNNHATLTLQNAVLFLSAEVAGGANIAVATDNIAVSAKGSASAQAAQVASQTTAPTGVSAFSSPTTKAAGLSLGSIPAGSVKAVWVKRSATNSSAINADGVTFAVAGDTAA